MKAFSKNGKKSDITERKDLDFRIYTAINDESAYEAYMDALKHLKVNPTENLAVFNKASAEYKKNLKARYDLIIKCVTESVDMTKVGTKLIDCGLTPAASKLKKYLDDIDRIKPNAESINSTVRGGVKAAKGALNMVAICTKSLNTDFSIAFLKGLNDINSSNTKKIDDAYHALVEELDKNETRIKTICEIYNTVERIIEYKEKHRE